jgi:hypothetical protein
MSAASIGCAAAVTASDGEQALITTKRRAEQQPDRFDHIRLIVGDQHAEGCRGTQPANRLGDGTFKNGSFNWRHKNGLYG